MNTAHQVRDTLSQRAGRWLPDFHIPRLMSGGIVEKGTSLVHYHQIGQDECLTSVGHSLHTGIPLAL